MSTKLIDILREAKEVGAREVDPETGVTTIFRGQNPQTGGMTWDVENKVDLKFVYKKLDDLVKYMGKPKEGSKEDKIKIVLKTLRNKVSRLN